MPRENSFSDSEGRSLTPDLEEISPFAPIDPTLVLGEPEAKSIISRLKSTNSKKSVRSRYSKVARPTLVHHTILEWDALSPKDRFRAVVRKIMSMQHGTSILGGVRGVGAEPGIDPRRQSMDTQYNHIHGECDIEIMDYSAVRSTTRSMTKEEFVKFMTIKSSEPPTRDPWVKVRWINIGGMSWDVIKAVSIKYDLHPLSLEDVLHGHSRTRSKADYYTKHLFVRVLCHELLPDTQPEVNEINAEYSTLSPEPIYPTEDDDDMRDDPPQYNKRRTSSVKQQHGKPSILPTSQYNGRWPHPNMTDGTNLSRLVAKEKADIEVGQELRRDELEASALKEGSRVNVNVSPIFIFLSRDGTIITIRPNRCQDFMAPITYRLRSRDTVLRKSADPSLLLYAMLDLIVDKSIQVVEKYHATIHKFERDILLKPDISTVRDLHILSGDLILRKRTLEPIKTLVYSLRRYDVDRAAALVDGPPDSINVDTKVAGFMSHKAKIYLADVYDHMDYVLTSLDMFAGVAENLIDYTFNTVSYEMNNVMRRLTTATIIFLPLTVLTGYFGMNFDPMWSVNQNSDLLFWKIAIPIMVLVVSAALWGDLKDIWRFVKIRAAARKRVT